MVWYHDIYGRLNSILVLCWHEIVLKSPVCNGGWFVRVKNLAVLVDKLHTEIEWAQRWQLPYPDGDGQSMKRKKARVCRILMTVSWNANFTIGLPLTFIFLKFFICRSANRFWAHIIVLHAGELLPLRYRECNDTFFMNRITFFSSSLSLFPSSRFLSISIFFCSFCLRFDCVNRSFYWINWVEKEVIRLTNKVFT